MLLAKKANPLKHLPGASARGLEPHLQARILALEFFDSLGAGTGCPGRRLERFHPRLGVQRAPSERRQLIAKMMDEFFEVRECGLGFRQFAV